MKNLIIATVIIILTASSCCYERIDGNGRVTTENRSVNDFDQVEADGVFNVILVQADEYGVEVETDYNLQDIVVVYTHRNTLHIETENHVKFDATRMDIYVYSPYFRKVSCDGVSKISSENTIESDFIEISNDGVGSIYLDLDCESVEIYLNGVGNIYLDGNTTNLKIRHNGVGKCDAYDMPAENVDIVNSGVGSSEIYVLKELDVTISGVGSVYYKGNPDYVNSTITGVGNLKHR